MRETWVLRVVSTFMSFSVARTLKAYTSSRRSRVPRTTLRRIEDVRVGDPVWAWSPVHKRPVGRRVARLYQHAGRDVVRLVLSTPLGLERVVSTPGHPYWVEDVGWVPARFLRGGDALKSLPGNVRVSVLRVERQNIKVDVFNFEVEGCHSYYVGRTGTLVHNSSGPNAGLLEEARALGSPSGRYRRVHAESLLSSTDARWLTAPFEGVEVDVRGRRPAASGVWKDFYPTRSTMSGPDYAVLVMKERPFQRSGPSAWSWMTREVDYITHFRGVGHPFLRSYGSVTAMTDFGARPAYVLELAPAGAIHSKQDHAPNPQFMEEIDLRAVPQLTQMIDSARRDHDMVMQGQVPLHPVLVDPQAFLVPAGAKRGPLLFQDPMPKQPWEVTASQTSTTISILEGWLRAAKGNGLPGFDPKTGAPASRTVPPHVVRPGVAFNFKVIGDKLVLQRYRYRVEP